MGKIIKLVLDRLQYWDLSYSDIETLLYKNGIDEDIYVIRKIMRDLVKEKKVYRKQKGHYVFFTLNDPKKKPVEWEVDAPIVEQIKTPSDLPDTPLIVRSDGIGKVTGKQQSSWERFIDLAKTTTK